MDKVNGYKTYILCAMMMAFSILGVALGKLDGPQAGTLILEALALAGLRHGVAKL